MFKLDAKDRQLLYELSLDSRQPLSALSNKVGLSRDFVNYRISRLVKNKIIKQFIAEVDVEKLGFSRNTVYLRFSNVNKEKENEIIDYIASNHFVTWVVSSVGKWNLIFDIIAKNNKHLYNLIEEMKGNYGEFFSEYKLAALGEYYFFPEKFFGKVAETEERKDKISEEIKIDETDAIILSFISKNARMANVEIAEKMKFSPEGVRKRIAQLQENNAIKRFSIAIDVAKLGLEIYNIQFVFEKYDKKREKELMNHLKEHPKIVFIYKPLSNWDVEFGLVVKNAYELNEELSQLRNKFSDLVKIHDSILMIEEIVPNILPEGIIKK